MSVVDLSRRRFEAAKDCEDLSPGDVLREGIARIEQDQWAITSVIVVALVDEGDGTVIDLMHGGPASTNERLGMLARAQNLMLGGDY